MKIVIISDIHANLAALESLPERDFDRLWCIGDLVDYGPRPHEAIQWVKQHAAMTVRGNHDHAVGFSVDPQCSLPFKRLAAETLRYTQIRMMPVSVGDQDALIEVLETGVLSTDSSNASGGANR